jgi:hypothetical protein
MTPAILYLGHLIDQQGAAVRAWLDTRPLGPVIVMLLIGIVCIGFASRERRRA